MPEPRDAHNLDRRSSALFPSSLPVPAREAVVGAADSAVPLDISKLLHKYGLLAVFLTFIGTAAGFLSVAILPPVYKAKVRIEVQPPNSSLLKMSTIDNDGTQVDLLTEAEILQSNIFVRKTLERLQLENITPAPVQTGIFSDIRRRLKLTNDDEALVEIVRDGLEEPHVPKALAMAVKSLEAHEVDRTRILEIDCQSTNPQTAATFLNALADEYIQQSQANRDEKVRSTTMWVDQQLEETKKKLLDAEGRLQEFVRNSGNLFVSQEKNDTLADSELRELQDQLAAAQGDLINKRIRYDMLQKGKVESLPDVVDNPVIQSYQSKIADLKREESVYTTTLTPQNLKVKKIEAQIAELQTSIEKQVDRVKQRITSEYEAAQRNKDLLTKSYATQAARVTAQASKEAQYNALQREIESARQTYNTMLSEANQASIVGSVPVNNVSIVDPAVPARSPSKPKPVVNIAAGAFAGLALCCGFGFLRETLDQRVTSPAHARRLFDLPQLGVIPSAAEGPQLSRLLPNPKRGEDAGPAALGATGASGAHLNLPVSGRPLLLESFRVTLASLMRESRGGRAPRVILVTSPGPAEGKTTIASNLGMALAETGRTVLLFDADFRRPRVHEVLGVANTHGLSDLLDEQTPINEYSKEALGVQTLMPGLRVLPNGSRSTNIAQALYSSRLRQLVERLRNEFDAVVIDAPPLLHLADARVMSEMTDGVVLVLRSGVTDKGSAVEALDQLRTHGTTILGTVLNDWKPSKSEIKKSYYYSTFDDYNRT